MSRRVMTGALFLVLGCGDADETNGAGGSGGETTTTTPASGPSTSTATVATGPGTTAGSTTGSTGAGGSAGDRLVGDEWFASDMDGAGDAPNFGFSSVGFSQGSGDADMTVSHQLGGPLGRPFVRQEIHTNQGEFGGGWFVSPLPSQCSWGCVFFFRFSFFPIGGLQQTQKIFVLSRQETEGRLILTVENWGEGYAWRLQKDGGEDLAQYPDVSGDDYLSDVDTWSHIQLEARYSSAPGAADGYYRLWVNNNDHASPDAERLDIVLETEDSGVDNFLGWSGYHQRLDDVGGMRSFGWADTRMGPSFDPSWSP